MDNYKIYKHTFPNGKVYIGLTSQEPKKRWGSDGNGYYGQKYIYRAIKKYGWKNIKHEILFDNLSKKNVIDIMNNINNVQRKSLDYQTPYELFLKQYGEDISKKFHLQQIPKDEINLSYKLLNK